jgi:hypothetical protein
MSPLFTTGSETVRPNSQWLLGWENQGYAVGSLVSKFGRSMEYTSTAIRSNATTGLFNRATLRCTGWNSSTNSQYTSRLVFDGDLDTLCNHGHGDFLGTYETVSTGSGVGGTTNNENFLAEALVNPLSLSNPTNYTIMFVRPTSGDTTPPMRPAIRLANPPTVNGGNNFNDDAVIIAAGNKDIHHFRVPEGNTTSEYTRCNLLTGAQTASAVTPNASGFHGWWNFAGTPTEFCIAGHNGGASYNSSVGRVSLGDRAKFRRWRCTSQVHGQPVWGDADLVAYLQSLSV